ncbi:Predicted transcriptional regulators containing the CopG/Arc/MetJ DNA-binding domain [Bordetella ansorpii]|uniref:Predicted transcriptional regulators containing the CopG/Arc/MetJ DNA-binding domain n=1 Tax=Bordetella ansorpii TaxID=288768 RepID=A0A157SR80_9BORD|nr:DUF1173 family protein [Bordetella ansorpii]SAI72970.1 Predicted transcriptional regulators containing the CopG/Arc/MetJ DNA-binding domain [Bordetella ansorpii]
MMDGKLYPAVIEQKGSLNIYDAAFQRGSEFALAWKSVLQQNYGKATVRCRCSGNGAKRLSIRCRADADTYHLARFPGTGPQHAADCVYWHADPTSSGLGAYQQGVVQETDDGEWRIRLRHGLLRRAPNQVDDEDTPQAAPPSPGGRGTKQPSMKLLGLLHFVWTQAGFNRWSPKMAGKRNLGVVHHHLLEAADNILTGRSRLSHFLLAATPQADGPQAKRNRATAEAASKQSRRLVVIAPLARHQAKAEGGATLPIAGFHGIPHLAVKPLIWTHLNERFGAELNAWRKGARTIAVLQTDVPDLINGIARAAVLDVALMRVTSDWIPVDSTYEAQAADWLVTQGRRFEKPLRFDASNEHTFPDFWLLDAGRDFPMEAWGRSDADYLRRRADKVQYYDAKYDVGGWWSWDASAGQAFPALPDAVSSPYR